MVSYHSLAEESLVKDYGMLKNAKVFSYGPVGYGGIISEESNAFGRIYRSSNARTFFIRLEKEATMEGKLYALCGIYFYDDTLYQKLLARYETMNTEVCVQVGCALMDYAVSKLVKEPRDNVVRLKSNNDTIDHWLFRNNKTGGYLVDFYGGGIPSNLVYCVSK